MKSRRTVVVSVLSLIILAAISFAMIMPATVTAGLLDWLYEDDGVVDPESYYQRYRVDEYPDTEPFFQWWYYTIKDLQNDRYWAISYGMMDCVEDLTNEGASVGFATVDKTTTPVTRLHKIESYSLSTLEVENYFDVQYNDEGVVNFEIEVINDDTYHIRGKMVNPDHVVLAEGCSADLYIEWDLTLYRIFGWYGQQDCESQNKESGIISWNTYAHDAEVQGTITIGETTYTISRNQNFRAYCDGNWGRDFPTGDPAIDHAWGWYYAGKPNATPSNDFSIIAGTGLHDAGFPLYDVYGRFGDIRFTSANHYGCRMISFGLGEIMSTSNDVDCWEFDVERSDWETYTDSLGSALIPLTQEVTMETEHIKVVMLFESELEDYNRLLFAHEYYIYSDFEGLGVDVDVDTWTKSYYWWDLFHFFPKYTYSNTYSFVSDDGGIEYGYETEFE
jgi:hypothetical protein